MLPPAKPTPEPEWPAPIRAGGVVAADLNNAQVAALLALDPKPGEAWDMPMPEDLQDEFPGYTVETMLGHGGMGAVYRGIQHRLGRPVAIKVLPPGVDDKHPDFADRFQREARAMAMLNHPGIAIVHDFGHSDGGYWYMVMELVDGIDLARMLHDQGKLAPRHAITIIAQLCDALAYAHARGIVHRDLKPSNILIQRDGRAKLVDFGIAKFDRTPDDGAGSLTFTNTAVGTRGYMAPEQAQGHAVDHRADIYGLGALLQEMLSGHPPPGYGVLPARPSTGSRHITSVVHKAMAMVPENRFRNVLEMKAALPGESGGAMLRNLLVAAATLTIVALAGAWGWQWHAEDHTAGVTAESRQAAIPSPHPPGQWIPAYHTMNLVRSQLADQSTWDDGWIIPSPAKNSAMALSAQPRMLGKDTGARAVFRWKSTPGARATITLRKQSWNDAEGHYVSDLYLFEVKTDNALFCRVRNTRSAPHAPTFLGHSLPLNLQDGEEVMIEAMVTDNILTGKVNGRVLQARTDGALADGVVEIATYGMPFRGLEFIHFDGMPTSAAMKIFDQAPVATGPLRSGTGSTDSGRSTDQP